MVVAIELARRSTELEERRAPGPEHVLYHQGRGTIVSITSQSLQEIDPINGSIVGEAAFDLFLVSERQPNGSSTSGRLLDLAAVAGSNTVVGVYQSRCLAVWDLQDMVLQSISEFEKQQKSIVALAASTCKDRWLFYASEGSNSIKVTCVDSKELPKKISRKAANRSSQLTCLAYHTQRRLLCAGASEGALQLWSFSEENTLGGKEEAAVVTPVFTTQTIQAPVVQITFAQSSLGSYMVVGYQNRAIEVWDIAPSPASRQREPFRVATIHALPPQAMDFSKKNGELSFMIHPQLPTLFIHWHAYNSAGSCTAATEFRATPSSGAPPTTLSQWCELLPVAPPSLGHDDTNATLLYWSPTTPSNPLAAYLSTTHRRQLQSLSIQNSPGTASIPIDNARLTLSSGFQLGLDQYVSYTDIPTALVYLTKNPETSPTSPSIEFLLHRVSLVTGEVEKLDDLPVWTNYQGRQLMPSKLRWNTQQNALCIQLQDPGRVARPDNEESSISYVMIELKAKANTGQRTANDDEGNGGGASSNVRVVTGSVLEALDVAFCQPRASSETVGFTLAVLATTGKSISLQTSVDRVDSDAPRVCLARAVQRIYTTPLALSPHSAFATTVACRLLYVYKAGADSTTETFVISEDDLSLPQQRPTWSTRANETIIDVVWNSTASDNEVIPMVAIWTTTRVVILQGATLAVLAEYDSDTALPTPQSLLWLVHTLLVITSDQQLRYVTPLRPSKQPHSRLLCSLSVGVSSPTAETPKIQLLSICGDRLGLAITDLRTLETKPLLRPIAICEPLLMGFTTPNDRLRAILERDILVFALAGGSQEMPRCPLTDALLDLLVHEFGWLDTTTKALDALLSRAGAASSASGASTGAGSASASYKTISHLSPSRMASVFLQSHKWHEFVRVFLASDPGLEEYALAEDGMSSSSVKLPSRTGVLAQQFHRLARVLTSLGQYELAFKCLDVSGDDLAMVEFLQGLGVATPSVEPLVHSLQRDWSKLNPPLSAIVKATMTSDSTSSGSQDLFALLCCDRLMQTERRSRLLTSVRPLDKLTMSVQNPSPPSTTPAKPTRASILYWKRLCPEDAKDAIGASSTPHFSSDEPKNPSYAIFHGASGSTGGLGIGNGDGGAEGGSANADGVGTSTSGSSNSNDKMTIGPFLEDEDAVVAYWRFEEGTTAGDDETDRTLDSMDTSKRENHLQVLHFPTRMKLATSTAPVDRGEEGKLQEAFSLRFPLTADDTACETEWGAKCAVRAGSTLDVGFVFDEDPYRRKFTFEAWIRNVALFKKQREAEEEGGDGFEGSTGGSDPELRHLVRRQGIDKTIWWELSLQDGCLALQYGDQVVRAEERIGNLGAWQHIAFSIDISSPKQAVLKLFVQARCVATKDVSSVDANTKLVSAATKALAALAPPAEGQLPPPLSTMYLGPNLRDYEMTEVRVWANARTQDQLSDMKENYLGIAEAKRRMKIAIHQRNCQCDKCLGRRTKAAAPAGKLTLGTPFPSTPPSTSSVRDRRRPQPKA